jgi:hypothetical protein
LSSSFRLLNYQSLFTVPSRLWHIAL